MFRGLVHSGFAQEREDGILDIVVIVKHYSKTSTIVISGCSVPLYCRVPDIWTDKHAVVFAHLLDKEVISQAKRLVEHQPEGAGRAFADGVPSTCITGVAIERRKNMMGYQVDLETGDPVERPYLRMEFCNMNLRRMFVRVLRHQSYLRALCKTPEFMSFGYLPPAHGQATDKRLPTDTYMSDNYRFGAYTLFQLKYSILPSRWIEMPLNRLIPVTSESMRLTRHCHAEYDIGVSDIRSVPEDNTTADLVLLLFDIETYSPDGSFPRSSIPSNTVSNIGVRVTRYAGSESDGHKVIRYVVLCLGKTSPSSDVEIAWFVRERELLRAFGEIVNANGGADLVVTYNGNNFDWPYLINRAKLFRFFSGEEWMLVKSGGEKHAQAKATRLFRTHQQHCASVIRLFNRLDGAGSPGSSARVGLQKELERIFYLSMGALGIPSTKFKCSQFMRRRMLPNAPEWVYIVAEYRTVQELRVAAAYFGSSPDISMDPFFSMGRRNGKPFDRVFGTRHKDNSDPRTRGIQLPHIINLDLMQWFKKNCKFTSYKLENIAQDLLGRGKLPMDYQEMFDIMREGDPDKLRVVAEYCAIDCTLLEELIEAKQILTQMMQLSRASKTMIGQTIGGQQVLCWNVLVSEAYEVLNMIPNISTLEKEDYVGASVLEPQKGFYSAPVAVLDFQSLYPSIMRSFNIDYSSIVPLDKHKQLEELERLGKVELVRTYTGGKPSNGDTIEANYHKDGIWCEGKISRVNLNDTYDVLYDDGRNEQGVVRSNIKADKDHLFVHHKVRNETRPSRIGVLPSIETKLNSLRRAVKSQMKDVKKKIVKLDAAGNSEEVQIATTQLANMDALQLAFKLLMNSMYGLAGARVGYLPDWRIASSITERGRWMINETKLASQGMFMGDIQTFARDSPHVGTQHRDTVLALPMDLPVDPVVIYGDTDSVFVRLGEATRMLSNSQIWSIGEVIAEYITQVTFLHEPEIVLEMEKFYLGFMLIKKKKYVGWVFKSADQVKGEHGGKGTLAVRRDTIPFQKTIYNDMRDIMFTRSLLPEGIREAVLQRFTDEIHRLCTNNVDPLELIQKKRISKPIEEYTTPPPHVAVATKIRDRHQRGDEVYGVATYSNGDYVSYILVMPDAKLTERQRKALRKGELAEDPTYWSNNRETVLLNIPLYLDRLLIVSELVSAFIDPDTMHGMLEASKNKFLRKYQRNHGIEEYMSGTNDDQSPEKRKRHANTVRAIGVQVKRKKNPLGQITASKRKQSSLRNFFYRPATPQMQ